jgi:hypothetical protein
MTEQVVQIPFVTIGFIKCAPMLLRYKTGYRQQERGSLRTRLPASSVIRSASASPASHTSRIGTVSPPPACDESGIPQHGDVRRGGLPQGTSSRLNMPESATEVPPSTFYAAIGGSADPKQEAYYNKQKAARAALGKP